MQKSTELQNFLNFKVAGLFTLVTVHANAQRDKSLGSLPTQVLQV